MVPYPTPSPPDLCPTLPPAPDVNATEALVTAAAVAYSVASAILLRKKWLANVTGIKLGITGILTIVYLVIFSKTFTNSWYGYFKVALTITQGFFAAITLCLSTDAALVKHDDRAFKGAFLAFALIFTAEYSRKCKECQPVLVFFISFFAMAMFYGICWLYRKCNESENEPASVITVNCRSCRSTTQGTVMAQKIPLSTTSIKLQSLKFGNNGAAALGERLARLGSVRSLSLARSIFLENQAASNLSEALVQMRITEIDFTGTKMGDFVLQGFKSFFESNACIGLITLNISCCQLGSAGGLVIAECLEEAQRLAEENDQKLHLKTFIAAKNALGNLGVCALSNPIKNIHGLTVIDFEENDIGPEAMEQLAAAIGKNKSLLSINLSRNAIGSRGAIELSKAIIKLTSLEAIYIADCFCRRGAAAIADVLPKHTIKTVVMRGNEINGQEAEEIMEALVGSSILRLFQTRKLEIIDLKHNNLGADFQKMKQKYGQSMIKWGEWQEDNGERTYDTDEDDGGSDDDGSEAGDRSTYSDDEADAVPNEAPSNLSDPPRQGVASGDTMPIQEQAVTPADFSDKTTDLKKPFSTSPSVSGHAHRPADQLGASRSSTMSTDATISSGMSKDAPSSSASAIDSKHTERNHDDQTKETLTPPTLPKIIVTEDDSPMPPNVGFESLPCQLVHYCKKQGFQFNLLCVGTTGSGKTTLMESLFNMKLELEPCDTELKSVELKSQVFEVEEGGVKVKLRFVETAGFGGQASVEQSAKTIVDYLDEQYEAYLREEPKVSRRLSQYNDTRIHACLYLISATGHGLLTRDLHTLRELSKRVNVIPIIARADTRCKDELVRFKKRVLEELRQNNIGYYTFPTDDEAIKKQNEVLNKLMPFAVVGSTDFVTKEDGSTVRARSYPWGIVEVENEEHCDFVRLREALLRLNVDSLRTRTHKILYEAYRQGRLLKMNMKDGDCGPKMAEAYEQMNSEFKAEMVKKDKEFDRIFTERVKQKEHRLKRREVLFDLSRQRRMEKRHEDEMRQLEVSIKVAEDELVKLKARYAKKKQSPNVSMWIL